MSIILNSEFIQNYEEKNTNLDHLEANIHLLYEVPSLNFFFTISLPSALKSKQPLGNILFVCSDALIRNCFLTHLQQFIEHRPHYISFSSEMKMDEFMPVVINVAESELLISNSKHLDINPTFVNTVKTVISDYALDIMIGKGPSANMLHLDLPKFTFVSCVEEGNSITSELISCFEYVLIVDDSTLQDLCISKIVNESIKISDEACQLIAEKSRANIKKCILLISRIKEYCEYHGIAGPITKEIVEEVSQLLTMNQPIPTSSDEEEMFSLFRDIRGALYSIKNEIISLQNNLSEIKSTIDEIRDYTLYSDDEI